jgi:hypothetical protein
MTRQPIESETGHIPASRILRPTGPNGNKLVYRATIGSYTASKHPLIGMFVIYINIRYRAGNVNQSWEETMPDKGPDGVDWCSNS